MAKAKDHKHAHHDHHDDDHGGHGDGGHDDHGGGGHCPPPWIITFADMATLLMAFFVIMLMSAKTDQPKFNAFASVMRQTFGRTPVDPTTTDKGGTSVLDLHFGPASGENTNDVPSNQPQSGDPNAPESEEKGGDSASSGGAGDAAGGGASGDGVDQAAEALAKAMRDAMAKGEMTVESDAGSVTVRLPAGTGAAEAQKIADALAQAAGAGGDAAGGAEGAGGDAAGAGGAEGAGGDAAGAGGAEGAGGDAAGAGGTEGAGGAAGGDAAGAGSPGAATENAPDAGTGGGSGGGAGAGNGTGVIRAKLAAKQIGMILDEQMAAGAVDVEQRDGAVVVTVGSGGAFESGSADMTAEAQAILDGLQKVSGKARKIVVTGHTDNVPLSGGEYRDNWELASARAASVVREIEASGQLPGVELVANSKGETEPIADNATEEGRAKNRRIEVEIEFAEEE